MILCLLLNKNAYLCKVMFRNHIIGKSFRMELKALIAECTAYDFKVMLEEKKPKSWLKSVSAFANGLGGSLFFGIDNDGIVKGLDDICNKKKAIDYKDYFRFKSKSTVSQFQGIIFASSDTTNVGDMSEAKVANCQQKNHKYHQGVSDNNRPLGVGCVVGEEG